MTTQEAKPWKLVVVGVLFKRTSNGPRVLTQIRRVQDTSYDPLYDGTHEAMGETLNPGESVYEALLRGCREEYGVPDFKPVAIFPATMLARPYHWETGKGDVTEAFESYINLHSLGPPQPWTGYAFAVEVSPEFEPNYDLSDGEANDCVWWDPDQLLEQNWYSPTSMMGWHIPAIHKLCLELNAGTL